MRIRIKFVPRDVRIGVFWRRKWAFEDPKLLRPLAIAPWREVFIFIVPCLPIVLSWECGAALRRRTSRCDGPKP